MASDDNPFARNSVWPRMPQAPFRVGPLPKAAAQAPPAREPEPAPEPPAASITPLYVRPAGATARPTVLAVGRVAPRAERPPPPKPSPSPSPPPEAEPVTELAPVVVQAIAAARPKVRRSAAAPTIGAGLVAAAGLGALAFVFLQGRDAAPDATAPALVAAEPEIATALSPPTPGPSAIAEPPPADPRPEPQAQLPARTPPPRRESAPPRLSVPPPGPPAAAAVEEAISAPVLDLPPAPEPAEPLPAYAPPAQPDPDAPMTTRRPY